MQIVGVCEWSTVNARLKLWSRKNAKSELKSILAQFHLYELNINASACGLSGLYLPNVNEYVAYIEYV